MARRIRVALLAVLTGLALFGPPGGTQIPVNPVPPLQLSSAVDIGVLKSSLESTQHLWHSQFAAGGVLQDISMRCLLGNATTRVYWGGVRTPNSQGPVFSSSSLATATVHAMVYLHQVGQTPSLPPDQIFMHSGDRGPSPRVQNRIATTTEFSFLLFVLGEIAGTPSGTDLGALALWFQNHTGVTLENFSSGFEGGVVRLDLRFREGSPSSSVIQTYRITAVPTVNGFDQVVVQ